MMHIEKLGLSGDTYTPNPDATTLYDVHVTLTYITESHASREPADSTQFERTDRYTYILELDKDRKIIGGEWYGDSQKDHPDFLWNPRRARFSSVPHLDLDTVRMLIQKSRKPQSESGEGDSSATTAEPIEFEVLPDLAIPDNDEHGLTIELTPSGIQGVRPPSS